MPVYNGEQYISEALESLIAQSFIDWKLLVSDNGSNDNTKEIVQNFGARDSRIRYILQPGNLGAPRNFIYLLDQANSPFFMWAAADDLWKPRFLESCIRNLQNNPKIGMAFTGIRNIDSFGRPIREYPDFPSLSGKSNIRTIGKYLYFPEVMGKANLIYGVYRTSICQEALRRSPLNDGWGSDMCFVLAAISLSGVTIDPNVLFLKRLQRESDLQGKDSAPLEVIAEGLHASCPLNIFPLYRDQILQSVKRTRFWPVAFLIMNNRLNQMKKLQKMNYVVVKLMGGLGNQMFQYATGRALADYHHVALKLDITGYEEDRLRKYELSMMNIRADIATPKELMAIGIQSDTKLLWAPFVKKIFSGKRFNHRSLYFKEKSFVFDPEMRNLKTPIYLDGYWQSERYFSDIFSALQSDFSLKTSFDKSNKSMLDQIICSNAVSLHVRRGDYVSNPTTSQYHGVCSLDYYRAAIDYMAKNTVNPHFFVFSDDMQWVADNLRIDHPRTLVQENGADRGAVDMALMKSCRHHIIANSSFSWWGAWLNPFREKIVVAPKRWFNQSNIDTKDLLPEKWVKL